MFNLILRVQMIILNLGTSLKPAPNSIFNKMSISVTYLNTKCRILY